MNPPLHWKMKLLFTIRMRKVHFLFAHVFLFLKKTEMKTKLNFLILIIFLFNSNLFSQSLEYLNTIEKPTLTELPIMLKYENSSGEKGISFFEFDGNNYLRKGRWELLDKSRHSINYYFYNEKNQLIEFYREFSDGLTGSIKFEYDEFGKQTKETFSRSDGVTGTATYLYSENGTIHKIVCDKMKGWFSGEIIYDSENEIQPNSATIYSKTGVKIGTIAFTYDRNMLTKEHWDFPGQWTQTFEWVYQPVKSLFTSSNVFIPENTRFRLKKENYDFNNESGGPSYFSYDELGKLIEKIFARSDSLKTVTGYDYQDNGLLMKSGRKYNDGKTGTFNYEWNDFRKLLKREFYIDEEKIGDELYFYTSTGQLESANWNNFDTWLSGTLTFEYSATGQINLGHFKGKNGFDAELEFSYDGDGNVSKIVWQFSFGKTQTYWFEYEKLY